MKATWSKNKASGKWGVRVVADEPFEDLPAEGSTITVTKKSGETSEVTVTKLIWQGEDNESKQPAGLYALD